MKCGYLTFLLFIGGGRSVADTSIAADDLITSLPGASSSFCSKQFSGFLNITPSKYIHYFYIESESNPKTDSIVFWTNGGPGCSGLLGLFEELGPWRPMAGGSVARNPASWTAKASMVFLEQPAGVGFSYTTNSADLRSNDNKAATDNLLTIKAFFNRFPERKTNTLYLASESYGGHYIPQLTLLVLNDADLNQNFGGFLVGNPFVSFASGTIGMIDTMWGLQVLDGQSWFPFASQECDSLDQNAYIMSDACYNALDSMANEADTLNPYALNFPVCSSSSGGSYNTQRTTTISSTSSLRSAGEKAAADSLVSDTGKASGLNRGNAFGHYSSSTQARTLARLQRRSSELRSLHTRSTDISTSSASTSASNIIAGMDTAAAAGDHGSQRTNSDNSARHGKSNNDDVAKETDREVIEAFVEPAILGKSVSAVSGSISSSSAPVVKLSKRMIGVSSISEYTKNEQDKDVQYGTHSSEELDAHTTKSLRAPLRETESRNEKESGESVSARSVAAAASVGLTYDPCIEDITNTYLNRFDVQQALHVLRNGQAVTWSMCSNNIFGHWPLMDSFSDVTPLYKLIYLHPNKRKGFKMLVFSGDSDGICATVGTQHWIYNVQPARDITTNWQPWVVGSTGQQGGYITKFSNGLSFATVHYAGHEVPAYEPDAALDLFTAFLNGSFFSFPDDDKEKTTSEEAPPKTEKVATWHLAVGLSVGLLGIVLIGIAAYATYIHKRPPPAFLLSQAEITDLSRGGELHGTIGRGEPTTIVLGINPILTMEKHRI